MSAAASAHRPRYTRLWIALACVVLGSFALLGFFGRDLYRN